MRLELRRPCAASRRRDNRRRRLAAAPVVAVASVTTTTSDALEDIAGDAERRPRAAASRPRQSELSRRPSVVASEADEVEGEADPQHGSVAEAKTSTMLHSLRGPAALHVPRSLRIPAGSARTADECDEDLRQLDQISNDRRSLPRRLSRSANSIEIRTVIHPATASTISASRDPARTVGRSALPVERQRRLEASGGRAPRRPEQHGQQQIATLTRRSSGRIQPDERYQGARSKTMNGATARRSSSAPTLPSTTLRREELMAVAIAPHESARFDPLDAACRSGRFSRGDDRAPPLLDADLGLADQVERCARKFECAPRRG